MSCNGCRILRKGCNENCMLRQSLQGIESPQSQSNATVFVAKFFGRAGLMSFISAVPESQRPALFQSLLYEACGRTVNPVSGAIGLLSTGNWNVCQAAVETVLRGGSIRPMLEFFAGSTSPEADGSSEVHDVDLFRSERSRSVVCKRNEFEEIARSQPTTNLDFGLTRSYAPRMTAGGRVNRRSEKRRPTTPSMNSEASGTTTMESGSVYHQFQGEGETKLLRLFPLSAEKM